MFEQFQYLYADAGSWAQPILMVSVILFGIASVMLFTVKVFKKFIFLLLAVLILPMAIGLIGHLEMTNAIDTAISERGAEITQDMIDSAKEISYKPIQLALVLSILPIIPTIVGLIKIYFGSKSKQA